MLRPTLAPSRLFASRRLASTNPPPPQRTPPPPSASAAAAPVHDSRNNFRRHVIIGGVALITVVGAVSGARLKNDRDVVKQHQELHVESSIEKRIAILEDQRAGLVATKMPLERKLAGLRARTDAQEEQDREKEERSG